MINNNNRIIAIIGFCRYQVMDESVKEILALKEMALDADENKCRLIVQEMQVRDHPSGYPRANRKSISHRCFLRELAFEWWLTHEIIYLPVGCLQGGDVEETGFEFWV